MATKQTSPKYDGQTAKDTEIAALREFRAQFTDSTYMASFLSECAIDYFVRNVRDDFSPNIWELVTLETERAQAVTRKLENAERELAGANERADRFEKKYQSAVETIGAMTKNAESLSIRLENAREMEIAAAVETENARARFERTIAEREAEIIRLKAMIFDLEHSAK